MLIDFSDIINCNAFKVVPTVKYSNLKKLLFHQGDQIMVNQLPFSAASWQGIMGPRFVSIIVIIVKYHKITNNSKTFEAKEKTCAHFESL
jgi:hypothetical protein